MEENQLYTNTKFYSMSAILVGTFIGGPIGAGYLIYKNLKKLNKSKEATTALITGIVITFFIFSMLFNLPDHIIDKIPNYLLPAIYMPIVYYIAKNQFGDVLENHKENNLPFYSIWTAVGISFIILMGLLIFMFSLIYLSSMSIL